MRTYTVVPSFEGESAFFELPDIGFQGDHLSFAILFNLTELTEHWPDILPSMIVTNPKGETFIAPHTRWNAEKHIFTWYISSVETTYEGFVKCQLKCMSAEDPETIVCMSRICQTRVYQSLEAATDPPEAFQSWIDALAQLGAEITADATVVLESVEATENNARVAREAAEDAALSKAAAQQARNSVEQTAQITIAAQESATQAQQRAQNAADAAAQSEANAAASAASSAQALEEIDAQKQAIDRAAASAEDSVTQAATAMANAVTARNEAIAAKEAAQVAKGSAERAQNRAEIAEEGAAAARTGAENAQTAAEYAQAASEEAQRIAVAAQEASQASQNAAETAQRASESARTDAESARDLAETARDNAEIYADKARKWAEGKDYQGNDVAEEDETYDNHARFWAGKAEENASVMYTYMADIQENVGIVNKLSIEIERSDWIQSDEPNDRYPWRAEITDEHFTNTQLPMIVFTESSLDLAFGSRLCSTIRSYNGFVRVRSMYRPNGTLTGTLYMFGDGLSGEFIPPAVDDIGIATDEDVGDMIDDVFGDDSGGGSGGGSEPPEIDDSMIATDEEVDDMIDDVFDNEP